jgi:hypothetical protein
MPSFLNTVQAPFPSSFAYEYQHAISEIVLGGLKHMALKASRIVSSILYILTKLILFCLNHFQNVKSGNAIFEKPLKGNKIKLKIKILKD